MFAFLRQKAGSDRSRRSLQLVLTQVGALVLALAVAALLQVPLAADQIAQATPPPPPTELVQQRSETSRTLDNHDGTYTRTLFSGPIHYRDGQRRWQPISSEIVPADEPGYAWRNEANSFATIFKSQVEGDYLRFRLAGRVFSLSLDGAAPSSVQRRRFGVSYPEVFPGVDLRYDLLADRLKETLVLANAQAPRHYRFLLTPPENAHLRAEQREDGSWALFRRARAAPLFVFEAPSMTERGGVISDLNHVSMSVSEVGSQFAIDLNVDAEWLADPLRQFPVRLDPTIAIQPPVQDTNFDAACPTCKGVADARLSIGTEPVTPMTHKKWRSAVQFDLGDIPAGANITDAQLKLYFDGTCLTGSCGTSGDDLNLHRLTAPWVPTATSSTFTFDPPVVSSFTLPAGAAPQWMNWNLIGLVGNWIGGQSNYGVLIKRATEVQTSKGPRSPSSRYAEPTLGPKLEITYTGDGVDLAPITSVHSNGAELNWTRFDPPSGATFEKYEIHRSPTANFSPSSSTLLATLRDVVMTKYTDTTAAPNRTFSYRIVANASISNERRLTLPADGQASKVVQAEAGLARATYIAANYEPCQSSGGESKVYVGATSSLQKYRSLLDFDLRTIPANSNVSGATLSLWHPDTLSAAITVEAHAVTADWEEGYASGLPGCGAGGGTSWLETEAGISWLAPGGDFEPASSSTLLNLAGEQASWDNFALTDLVQRWVDLELPNHGVLLKVPNEELGATWFSYYSNDWTVSPTLRPKLAVSYADGSHALSPTAAISEPAPEATVSGGAVTISAVAGDDRRVDQVEFLVGSQIVGTDTSEPFSISWDSRTVSNVWHTLTARATDDAGNVTTSDGVTVQVANSNPPTTSITSPPNGANLAGTFNVTANANDDFGVTKVEFYVDKVLRATDTSSPYEFSWNTLDPDHPAYDGPHTLQSRAYDAHGQSTISGTVSVTTANTVGTPYDAVINIVGPSPDYVVDDPSGPMSYGMSVYVRNTSSVSWSQTVLRYRWYSPDSPPVVTNGDPIVIGDLAPNDDVEQIVLVEPPLLPNGVSRAQYRLRFDLFDQSSGTWFAAHGNRPYERQVIVNKALPVGLGVESYYRYDEESLGAGMRNLVNVASGNSILQWTPFSAPGRGLSTNVDLTYNSLESKSESAVGNNFSLSVSSLTRFGLPLEVHPTEADILAGRNARWIGFVDADGTAHRFEGRTAPDNSVYWEEPAGQHLYLREFSTTDPDRKWAFTTPDRTTYFYDDDGYPTSVQDGNGNRIAFTLEEVTGGAASGVTKRVVSVTDAAGLDSPPKPNRSFAISYYTQDDTRAAPVVDRVKRITDHDGSALDFFYYDDGNLRIIKQVGGASPNMGFRIPVADRSFVFTYTTPDGEGPAIPGPPPPDPDPGVLQSTRLHSVLDPRAHETVFAYVGPQNPDNRWKLSSRVDRAGATTSFSYDLPATETTVTAPLSRLTKYRYDGEGKVTRITRPDNELVTMTWTSDRMLSKTFEPTGAYTELAYNDNGDVTDEWDQLRNRTLYEYDNLTVDGNDTSGKWRAGRTIPHLSQLAVKTEPKGTATPGVNDYRTEHDYNVQGNLIAETDALGNVTHHTYRSDGTLETTTVDDQTTTYADIDANGFSTRVIDPLGRVSTSGYDDDGLLLWQQDRLHFGYSGGNTREYRTYFDYDSFHRSRRQSSPVSTSAKPGAIVWTGTDFDANDNVVATSAPFEGNEARGLRTTTSYDNMDRQELVTGPDRSVDPNGERTEYVYDPAGRLTRLTSPKGMLTAAIHDFAIFNDYDVLDRVSRETVYEVDQNGQITATLRTYYCYSQAGDLVSVTAPAANINPPDFSCSAPNLPYTTRYTYDAAHRQLSNVDPLGHTESTSYDANGNEASKTDENGKTTTNEYSQNDQLTKAVEPFKTVNGEPRNLTTKLEYDAVGRVKREISPRAWDASPDKQTFTEFGKGYQYDDAGQLVRVDLPTSAAYPQAHYLHNVYDANGNLATASQPVATADPGAVPADKKTALQYFDDGAIRTSKSPGNPRTHFDHTPRGAQDSRIPENADGELDPARQMIWQYDGDGVVTELRDEAGNASTYTYDANNNVLGSVEARGLTSPGEQALELENSFDGFERLTKVRSRNQGETNYTATRYEYDLNGNVREQETNAIESLDGTPLIAGRIQTFLRNEADWVTSQEDDLGTQTPADDQKVTNQWSFTGLETQRTRATGGEGNWQPRQVTNWDHYANGDLKTLTATKASDNTILESHEVSYEDASGNYVNGNRVSDQFFRRGPTPPPPPAPQPPCQDAQQICTATYSYDARERLVSENDGHGTVSTFALDAVGNVTTETVSENGGVPVTRAFDYAGLKLQSITRGESSELYFYDESGNVDCATTGEGSVGDCSPREGAPVSANLLQDYAYDYKNRVASASSFDTSMPDGNSRYVYDALDRPVDQRQTPSGGSGRTHRFTYAGITNQVTSEEERSASEVLLATKTYTYDGFGHRTSVTNLPNGAPATLYLYGEDVHGSVSTLLGPNDSVAASYAYRAYGASDAALTLGDTSSSPLNTYRYAGKRLDSVSDTYDMGARRFAAHSTRFVQQDLLSGAGADVRLAKDLLTADRYGLAGGNPIGYVEFNGHYPREDGEGGGGGPPNAPPPDAAPPGDPGDPDDPDDPGDPGEAFDDWEYADEGEGDTGGEGDSMTEFRNPGPPGVPRRWPDPRRGRGTDPDLRKINLSKYKRRLFLDCNKNLPPCAPPPGRGRAVEHWNEYLLRVNDTIDYGNPFEGFWRRRPIYGFFKFHNGWQVPDFETSPYMAVMKYVSNHAYIKSRLVHGGSNLWCRYRFLTEKYRYKHDPLGEPPSRCL